MVTGTSLELKSMLSKMKNSLEGVNSICQLAEESTNFMPGQWRLHDLKNRKEKMKRNEQSHKEM